MIAYDQSEEAIRGLAFALEEFELPRHFLNSFLLIQNQFSTIKRENLSGMYTSQEYMYAKNKVLKQILEFIDEIVDWVRAHQTARGIADNSSLFAGTSSNMLKPFLIAKGIQKSYTDFNLGPMDITLEPGKINAVFGANGSGKSTLLNILAGVLQKSSGTLEYFGQGTVTDWYPLKMQLGYIPQQIQDKDINLIDLLKYKCITHDIRRQDLDYYVQDVITKLNLASAIHKPWHALSGGFKMRVELASTLVWRPSILILDEPLANLDIVTQRSFISDLLSYARSKTKPISILLTSQHIEVLETQVDEIIFLNDGQIVFSGAQQKLAEQALVQEIEIEIQEPEKDQDLTDFLEHYFKEITVRKDGSRYMIKTPREVSIFEIIHQILNAGFKVTYYKDVSSSVRKLFNYEQD